MNQPKKKKKIHPDRNKREKLLSPPEHFLQNIVS